MTTDVIIVGGGPVGVGLAVDLGLRGIRCLLIERREELSSIPKGQALTQRTMELFHRWGIVDEIRAARVMPEGYGTGMVTVYGSLMGEFWQAPPARELVQDYFFERHERLPQYRTEEVLRRRMAQLPTVEARFGWAATDLEQHDEGVRVTVERDGEEEVVEGSYVVGCDGARSMVRETSNIDRRGTDWDELVVLVVFRSRELHAALERFPDRGTFRVMHPDLRGYWRFFGRIDVGEGFFFHAPVAPGTTRENLDVAALLHEAAGFDFAFEVDHVGFWDLRVQVANVYRSGRAFIAGDAAHTHPPYGGFGLNNGLEDAANLGWKLAGDLQGWGGPGLLESYSLERQAVFEDVGERIIGGWINEDRRFLERFDPQDDREAFADAFERMAQEYGRRFRWFEPSYDGSPIVVGPPDAVISGIGEHRVTARPGHHLAPRPLSSGRNVFEELGDGFTLLAFDAPDEDVEVVAAAATSAGMPLTVLRDTRADGREDYAAGLVLVRPDQYVAWAANDAPADADEVIRIVSGHA